MAGRHDRGFRRSRRGVEARFSSTEALLLRQLAAELLELLEDGATPVPTDPLEALVGLSLGRLDRPHDPVLARLLPDAYADDEQAAADFRRYTEPELRAAKRSALRMVVTGLGPDGGRVVLDEVSAGSWLGALNDLRLALGTRLDVDEDVYAEIDRLVAEDPRLPQLALYEWLGGLEETLVHALAGW